MTEPKTTTRDAYLIALEVCRGGLAQGGHYIFQIHAKKRVETLSLQLTSNVRTVIVFL